MTNKTNSELKGKLVRDKIPEIILSSGKKPIYTVCEDDDEYFTRLTIKLEEEVKEFKEATTYKHKLEECADIFEVLKHIISFLDIDSQSWCDFLSIYTLKEKERGAFTDRIVLKGVEENDK